MRGARLVLMSSVAVLLGGAAPAHAVHLFPLTPMADPLGHDCAKGLQPAPAVPSAGKSYVAGFRFIDSASLTSTTRIPAGQSVTWDWVFDHCHSVTFLPGGEGTNGGPGYAPAQPQLVRSNGSASTFTMRFDNPGEYSYVCVHHASVGMSGTVVVA